MNFASAYHTQVAPVTARLVILSFFFASAYHTQVAPMPGGMNLPTSSAFASAYHTQVAPVRAVMLHTRLDPLPRRTTRRLRRQKHTKCNHFLCEIHRELVDSFSSTDRRDTRADYFPKLFCCQGDLYRHYRQHRTDNRPFLVRSAPTFFCLICLRTNEGADESPR